MKSIRVATIVAVVAVGLLVISQPSMSREFADIYTDCGLGAMIAPRTPEVAAVTNVTWDLGTTAVSSNISSPEACVGGKEKTATFIHDSYSSLEEDLAKGDGKYLDMIPVLAGCKLEVHKELKAALRNDFVDIVAAPGYSEQDNFVQAQALYDVVYKHVDGEFAGSCS